MNLWALYLSTTLFFAMTSVASASLCEKAFKFLNGHAVRYVDMVDDPVEVTDSNTINSSLYGLVFQNNSTEVQPLFTADEYPVQTLNISLTQSTKTKRCVFVFSGILNNKNPFIEKFELIAYGSESLWLGNLNEEGGEIYFRLDKLSTKQLTDIGYPVNAKIEEGTLLND